MRVDPWGYCLASHHLRHAQPHLVEKCKKCVGIFFLPTVNLVLLPFERLFRPQKIVYLVIRIGDDFFGPRVGAGGGRGGGREHHPQRCAGLGGRQERSAGQGGD